MEIRDATWPSGTRIRWRSLNWGEFNKLILDINKTPAEKALEVYRLCLLEGPAPHVVSAGIVNWIGRYELENSIFTGRFDRLSLPLQHAREALSKNYLMAAQALIVSVFKIPFSEMDTWDEATLIKRIAQAEFIYGKPLDPVNPDIRSTISNPRIPKKELTPTQRIALERRQEQKSKR